MDLRGYDLSYADLNWVNLREADLSNANLYRAQLQWAYLRLTNLTRANLQRANVCGVNFRGANLQAANFTEAVAMSAVFADLDLRPVIGLAKIRHVGPSTIGLDTVYRSSAQIPIEFLQGVGVPDPFISFMNSLVEQPIQYYSCFISYSHEDKQFARRLHEVLQNHGIRCWLDEKQLLPGDDIYEQVDRGIQLWDKVLLCCSEASLTSWWVDNEIGVALEKEQHLTKARGKRLIHSSR